MTTIDVPALREAVGLRDVASGDAARARLDTLAKPLGSLGRLEALLVNRSSDTSWWDAVERQVDRVTTCFLPHLAEVGRATHPREPLDADERRAAQELARIEEEHSSLLDELAELRSLVANSARSQGSVSRALAASTEVIALLRGHNRRHRTMGHHHTGVQSGADSSWRAAAR